MLDRMKTASAYDIEERSYLPIDDAVLDRLAVVAGQDREDFFRRNPRWDRLYRDRVLCASPSARARSYTSLTAETA
jgi:hypothetical protein